MVLRVFNSVDENDMLKLPSTFHSRKLGDWPPSTYIYQRTWQWSVWSGQVWEMARPSWCGH